jgi:CheY-like chemotaxis protein
LGKGATFLVSLPVVVSRSSHVDRAAVGAPPETADVAGSDDLTGVKVLAIDDDVDSLGVIKRVLTSRRADVQTASSVAEALVLFNASRPDIILSDIGMPDRDGYELIRSLRALPSGKTVPAAALTALARSEDRMRALNAGYQAHVSKPVAPAELIAVVRSLVSLR